MLPAPGARCRAARATHESSVALPSIKHSVMAAARGRGGAGSGGRGRTTTGSSRLTGGGGGTRRATEVQQRPAGLAAILTPGPARVSLQHSDSARADNTARPHLQESPFNRPGIIIRPDLHPDTRGVHREQHCIPPAGHRQRTSLTHAMRLRAQRLKLRRQVRHTRTQRPQVDTNDGQHKHNDDADDTYHHLADHRHTRPFVTGPPGPRPILPAPGTQRWVPPADAEALGVAEGGALGPVVAVSLGLALGRGGQLT